jgi:hypothetical protein
VEGAAPAEGDGAEGGLQQRSQQGAGVTIQAARLQLAGSVGPHRCPVPASLVHAIRCRYANVCMTSNA